MKAEELVGEGAVLIERNVGRRQVLGVALTAALLGACGAETDEARGTPKRPGSGGGPGSGGDGGAEAGGAGGAGGAGSGGAAQGGAGGGPEACEALDPACLETEDNPLGPYYRPNAPFTTKLDNPKGTGDVLVVEGRVFASDCMTPLVGAVVEVWQADADGDYDNEKGDPGSAVWLLRGSIETDGCGRYEIETIIPGRYLDGAQYRPAHIHYRVSHPSALTLVTQLYFEGDPYNAIDSMYEKALEIALVDEVTPMGQVKRGVFDIVLPST